MRVPFATAACVLAVSVALSSCDNDDDDSNNNPVTVNQNFNRIAAFPVCKQLSATCDTNDEVAAEIVAASTDGNTLIYSNSPDDSIGFVDITTPSSSAADGVVALSGEPTSVAVKDSYVLVGVNTSADFVNTSGQLDMVSIENKQIIASLDLGGQPDSVAVSPDGSYAAVVIENERDEDLGEGIPPQAPAGFLVIINLNGEPDEWTTSKVDLSGIADIFPGDPEPEYVDINKQNIAVVTLQENNYIALVDLASGNITKHFSAGTVDLTDIDTEEEEPARITLTESQQNVPREPDGVSWISDSQFATADEGDMDGGSRGFTIFNSEGEVIYTSGNTMDHQTVRMGHYPDGRSGNKGNEPENADFGAYGNNQYLFVASERSSLIFVYDVSDTSNPVLKQTLPAGVGPEGVLAMPARNLLVAASEVDDRGDKIRSVLNIYRLEEKDASYPTLVSADDAQGNPIPWSAISGLAADANDGNTLYAVEDSFYGSNRIFKIDVSTKPAKITEAITLKDSNNVLAGLSAISVDATAEADDATRKDVFDSADLAAIINDDSSINIDPEGIAVASDGGFWVASEGAGTKSDSDARPINSLNMVLKTDDAGVITDVITLPQEDNDIQVRFGFEGVSEYNGKIYVAIQRTWDGQDNPQIGIYDTATETWTKISYPLDAPESQNAGWVGLSDITSLGDGTFLVLERDNQGGPDAAIKRLYKIDLSNAIAGSTIEKSLVRNLIPDLQATTALTFEKVEGSAVTPNGDVYIINDNDGVDDNSGETQLINLGDIL